MKAPPLLLGGSSPVVAYLRHSMIVWNYYKSAGEGMRSGISPHTVFPEPLYPTMRVSGVLNPIASRLTGPKERTPRMDSFSILDMFGCSTTSSTSSSRASPSEASPGGGRPYRWLMMELKDDSRYHELDATWVG